MGKKEERETSPIDDLEDGVELEDNDVTEGEELPPLPSAAESPWGDEEDDVDKDRDGEGRTRIFTLSVPNEEERDGRINPGYKKLCLDPKNFTLDPEDFIDCIVLDRIYPNMFQVPYAESKGLEPWQKMLGYSFDGDHPSVNKGGELFDQCIGPDDVPFFLCSCEPPYDPSKKNLHTPLADDAGKLKIPGNKKTITAAGECPWGRWANTLDAKTRKKFGIRSDKAKPQCDKHIIFFLWHLRYEVLFTAYFKRTSYPSARIFLQSLTKGFGDKRKKFPPRAFIARISLEKKGIYATSKIQNTNQWSDPDQVKPIHDYFKENRPKFVKNLAVVLEERKQKAIEAGEFPPDE